MQDLISTSKKAMTAPRSLGMKDGRAVASEMGAEKGRCMLGRCFFFSFLMWVARDAFSDDGGARSVAVEALGGAFGCWVMLPWLVVGKGRDIVREIVERET